MVYDCLSRLDSRHISATARVIEMYWSLFLRNGDNVWWIMCDMMDFFAITKNYNNINRRCNKRFSPKCTDHEFREWKLLRVGASMRWTKRRLNVLFLISAATTEDSSGSSSFAWSPLKDFPSPLSHSWVWPCFLTPYWWTSRIWNQI